LSIPDDTLNTNLLSELVRINGQGKKLDLIVFNGMAFTDGMEKGDQSKYYALQQCLVENHILSKR